MPLLVLNYLFINIVGYSLLIGGAIQTVAARSPLQAAAIILLPIPAGYLVACVTPILRNHKTAKVLAAPLFGLILIVSLAFIVQIF